MAIDMYTIGEGGLLGGSPGATQSWKKDIITQSWNVHQEEKLMKA